MGTKGTSPRGAAALTAVGLVAAAIAGACSPTTEVNTPTVTPATPAASTAETESPRAPAAAPEARTTQVAVLDPAALAALEDRGFTLGELVVGAMAETTEQLAQSNLAGVFDALDGDVRAVVSEHPTALVSSVLGTRLFERKWLRSSEMRFELIGVFNRMDRRVFYDGTCGEVRFVYRLAYTTPQGGAPMHGRLPLTVNVVYLVPEGEGCQAEAQAWRVPAATVAPGEVAQWLLKDGALEKARRDRWTLKAVETNLQTVRVQSTAHASMGGHIEYSIRVFHPKDAARTAFVAAPMDNMPDVARLQQDEALRADLVKFLRAPATLAAIDAGTVRLPERFLATSARTVAPRGFERPINRPFRQVLRDEDLAELDLAAYRTIGSSKALVRRLDGLSCVGCHQSRSIAGFHHVGLDAPDAPAWRSLVSGASTHLRADLERRRGWVEAVASAVSPDEMRPHAERQGNEGGFGAVCGLGDPGFAAWTCRAGLTCTRLESDEVGVCLDTARVGAPCEVGGRVVPGRTPNGDRVSAFTHSTCGPKLGCSPNINGFPMGSCAGHCVPGVSSAACVGFVDIDGFQACLRVGRSDTECAERYTGERIDRACDVDHPCRQDFVCAKIDDAGRGACIPPYFVFPLRADGYPLKK